METGVIILMVCFAVGAEPKHAGNSRNTTLQNNGNSGNRTRTEDHTSELKAEIRKHLRECGGSVPDDENPEAKYNSQGGRGGGYRGGETGSSYRGGGSNRNERNSEGSDEDYRYRSSNNRDDNRRMGSSDRNRNWSNRYGHSNDEDDRNENTDRDNYGNSRRYQHNNNNGRGGYDFQSNRDDGNSFGFPRNVNGNNRYGRYGNEEHPEDTIEFRVRSTQEVFDRPQYDSRDVYRYRSGYVRPKRSQNEECVSQCVFGYLDVLDHNRSPSESAFIKWLSDNIESTQKKVRAFRDTRRCFAKLAASDTEDGCEFSKSLSECLNLEIEE